LAIAEQTLLIDCMGLWPWTKRSKQRH